MPTRAAAAKEAAFIASSATNALSSPPAAAAVVSKKGRVVKKAVVAKKGNLKGKATAAIRGADEDDGVEVTGTGEEAAEAEAGVEVGAPALLTPAASAKGKRRRATPKPSSKKGAANAEPVKGGWDELPHNIGKIDGMGSAHAEESGAASVDAAAIEPATKKTRHGTAAKSKKETDPVDDPPVKSEDAATKDIKDIPKKRASRGKAKTAEPTTPESLDQTKNDPVTTALKREVKTEEEDIKDEKPKKKRAPRSKKLDTSIDVQDKVDQLLEAVDKPAKKVKKGKKNPYGLTPGETPFPDFDMPTVEACHVVNDLLATIHGKVEPPKEIPAPSLEVTGCGEVPSVLDALIRTRLSASTTSTNAGYAFAGLVQRYGILKDGIGAGSVDWNAVRESPVEDIEKAILKGGLAKTKSTSIKSILEMVYQHNVTRCNSFAKERDSGIPSDLVGADKLTQGQKDLEISTREKGVLSLDYMHGMNAEDAMTEFVQYPGIGVKTASCVILFCLRRPSFAVDTHVWRFCKWLKWIPEGATRDQAFSHCEVRVPNELKYPLHQLLIRHGKTCGRCRAATGEGSENWESTVCPIENLVERTGKRKAGGPARDDDSEGDEDEQSPKKKRKKAPANAKPFTAKTPKTKAGKPTKGKKAKKAEEWESDIDISDDEKAETPELDDDDDDSDSELSNVEDMSD